MKKVCRYILLVAALLSCSVTRHIPAGEQLYIGTEKIVFADADQYASTATGDEAMEEARRILSCRPNGSLAGSSRFRLPPVGLWWYYTFRQTKDKLGRWLYSTFATPPVLISDVKPALRAEAADEILKYYGYFNSYVKADTITDGRNPRKAKVRYTVTLNAPWIVGNIAYTGFPAMADSLITAIWNKRLVRAGEQFNASKMEEERTRLSILFRNSGCYLFQPQYITFLADTMNHSNGADIRIQPTAKMPADAFKIWRFGKPEISVTKDNEQEKREKAITEKEGFTYSYHGGKPPVRAVILSQNIAIKEGERYSQALLNETMELLSRTNIFSNMSFNIQPHDNSDTLDININATLEKPYDLSFELNATSKSNGQIGPGSKINLVRKNLFRSGERLKFSLKGSYEWQTDKKVKGTAAVINSWEAGGDISLEIPRLFPTARDSHIAASTSFGLYCDVMNRSGFFRLVRFGGDAIYKIHPHGNTIHTVIPFRLTYDMLSSTTARFDSIASKNPSIKNSFRDQFIPAMQYTYLYDNSGTTHRNKTWIEASVTSAGNITSLIFMAAGKKFNEKDKSILGNPYAQFIKSTAEMRQLWKIDNNQYIATRIMAGAIFSYGNSAYAPYSEQFYIGGANSLRAFTIRSVGPGSYYPEKRNRYSYLDETGTLKLEMNIEYRFRIISDIHGAVFFDAGNIWLMKATPERPGGEIRAKSLWQQIALDTGFGVRYDLGFLVLRLDFGVGLHAPYDTGHKGYFNIPPFKEGFTWHFAIGYPF